MKKAIDDMVAQLLKEKADEIKHKDFCVDEFNTNQVQTERKEAEKQDLLALIEDLQLQIKTLTGEIDTLKSEISELNLNMKRGGEDREKENQEFQKVVADQRASQKLLTAALDILKGVFLAILAAALHVEVEFGNLGLEKIGRASCRERV